METSILYFCSQCDVVLSHHEIKHKKMLVKILPQKMQNSLNKMRIMQNLNRFQDLMGKKVFVTVRKLLLYLCTRGLQFFNR